MVLANTMPVDDALAARKSDVGQKNLRSHLQTRITAGLNHGADVISILFANNRRGPPLRHGVCATTARQTNLLTIFGNDYTKINIGSFMGGLRCGRICAAHRPFSPLRHCDALHLRRLCPRYQLRRLSFCGNQA